MGEGVCELACMVFLYQDRVGLAYTDRPSDRATPQIRKSFVIVSNATSSDTGDVGV